MEVQKDKQKPKIEDNNNKDNSNFNHVIRVANTDIDGNKQIAKSLRKVKGINFMFSNAICSLNKIDKNKKAGDLTVEEVKKINDFIKSPELPDWMLNRRKDPETGENKHVVASDVKFFRDNDIKQLKKIKCYKGVRHMFGLPVRGQRTKSNFRRNRKKGSGIKKKA